VTDDEKDDASTLISELGGRGKAPVTSPRLITARTAPASQGPESRAPESVADPLSPTVPLEDVEENLDNTPFLEVAESARAHSYYSS